MTGAVATAPHWAEVSRAWYTRAVPFYPKGPKAQITLRQATYEAFINALHANPGTINVLLVDSETPIAAVPDDADRDAEVRVAHLTQRDQWDLDV